MSAGLIKAWNLRAILPGTFTFIPLDDSHIFSYFCILATSEVVEAADIFVTTTLMVVVFTIFIQVSSSDCWYARILNDFLIDWCSSSPGWDDQALGWLVEHQQGWGRAENTFGRVDGFSDCGRTQTDNNTYDIFLVQDVMPGIEIILGQKGHFWLQSNFSSLDERW